MKIKSHTNQNEKENIKNHKSQPSLQVENNQKRKFGNDITQKVQKAATSQQVRLEQLLLKPIRQIARSNPKETHAIQPYEHDIFMYLHKENTEYDLELKFSKKKNRSKNARFEQIKFILSVAQQYKLKRTTIYLAVYYLDKYFTLVEENNSDTIWVTTQACLLIAMKYEQIYPPRLKKWALEYPQLIIVEESKIIAKLNFKLAYTSSQHYLEIYQDKYISQHEKSMINIGNLLLDLCLLSGTIYDKHPVEIVQAIFFSFRPTAVLEEPTMRFSEYQNQIKQLIINHQNYWKFLLKMQAKA